MVDLNSLTMPQDTIRQETKYAKQCKPKELLKDLPQNLAEQLSTTAAKLPYFK